MTTGVLHDQNLEKQIEKQMGCMAGFLQLFDRHHILTGKRLCATKRLPHHTTVPVHSPKVGSMPELESERSIGSPAYSERESQTTRSPPTPEHCKASEKRTPPVPHGGAGAEASGKRPLPLQGLEFKEGTRSSWKFKEAPRLSLDSRATVDARGSLYPKQIRTNAAAISGGGRDAIDDGEKQRRSPSVIARLMGLEPLQNSPSSPEPSRKAELRRSASESRVSRDLFQFRLSVDGNTFQMKQPQQSNFGSNVMMRDDNVGIEDRARDLLDFSSRTAKSEPPTKAANRGFVASPKKSPQQRKSYFDSGDFFPVPKQAMTVYGEIERRLKMRGIDEPSQDLENLKQIFEALQLKGLLHSPRKPNDQISRNFVYDRQFSPYESPIVVMKPSRSQRVPNESPPSSFRSRSGGRWNPNYSGEITPTASPRRQRPEIHRSNAQNQPRLFRNSNSPTRSDTSTKSTTTSSSSRRKPLRVETQRKANETTREHPQRRAASSSSSPTHSPKLSSRGSATHQTVSRSPRYRKPTAEIFSKEDESSSVSAESTLSTSSQTDTERSKGSGDYRGGSNILERCDKLLHSIAEITASELQPSPVSVLDTSSFYKEESSPSPVMKKRSVGFGGRNGTWKLNEC